MNTFKTIWHSGPKSVFELAIYIFRFLTINFKLCFGYWAYCNKTFSKINHTFFNKFGLLPIEDKKVVYTKTLNLILLDVTRYPVILYYVRCLDKYFSNEQRHKIFLHFEWSFQYKGYTDIRIQPGMSNSKVNLNSDIKINISVP